MDRIHIQQLHGPAEHDVEIVERKGLGHPDTICDLVMEEISLALIGHRALWQIVSFNCDKGFSWRDKSSGASAVEGIEPCGHHRRRAADQSSTSVKLLSRPPNAGSRVSSRG
jgi:hypothetical protein